MLTKKFRCKLLKARCQRQFVVMELKEVQKTYLVVSNGLTPLARLYMAVKRMGAPVTKILIVTKSFYESITD